MGFHCHTKAFSSSGVWASHCSGFSSPLCSGRDGLQGAWACLAMALRLSGCSAWALAGVGFSSCCSVAQAYKPGSVWNSPRPEIRPMSPWAGEYLTTKPPGKSTIFFFWGELLRSTLLVIYNYTALLTIVTMLFFIFFYFIHLLWR